MKDWRDDYIICSHVADNPEAKNRHQRFRVCCEECYDKGFLWNEITKEKKGILCIGTLKGMAK